MTPETNCPSCEAQSTPLELSSNSGVCVKCKTKFAKSHKLKTFDDAPETYGKSSGLGSEVCWDGEHLDGVTHFDFELMEDRGDPMQAPLTEADSYDNIPKLADGLNAILAWCWRSESGEMRQPQTAFNHFTAMSAALNPDLLDSMSYKQTGLMIGVTRANVSKSALQFQRKFGCHFRRSRPAGATANYRAAAIAAHAAKREQSAGGQVCMNKAASNRILEAMGRDVEADPTPSTSILNPYR